MTHNKYMINKITKNMQINMSKIIINPNYIQKY